MNEALKNAPKTGRPPGSLNKTTKEVREFIYKLFDENRETLKEDFKRLRPRERWKLMQGLMSYLTPKLQSATIEFDTESRLNSLSDQQVNMIYNIISDENTNDDQAAGDS